MAKGQRGRGGSYNPGLYTVERFSMNMDREIRALLRMVAPTRNVVTDEFGAFRDWSGHGRGWSPSASYSPIHTGVDFAAMPDSLLHMPVAGTCRGEYRPEPVGSWVGIRPSINGSPSEHALLQLVHCEPTANEWIYVNKGNFLTSQAGYGIGQPHVHFEIGVTEQLGRALVGDNIVPMIPVLDSTIENRAREHGYNAEEVLGIVAHQKQRFGIKQLAEDVIVRYQYPAYRVKGTQVGTNDVYVINPLVLLDYNSKEGSSA